MSDASRTASTLTVPNVSQRALRWIKGLSLVRRQTLKFGITDLAVAVGQSRDLAELENEYSKSLSENDPHRVLGNTGRTLAQDHIRRMFAPKQTTSNAWNMEFTIFEEYRSGGGRVSLTAGGYELAAILKRVKP